MEEFDDNPWKEEEFNIKPIKLAKRRPSNQGTSPRRGSGTSGSGPGSPLDEFKMRPIRLSHKYTEDPSSDSQSYTQLQTQTSDKLPHQEGDHEDESRDSFTDTSPGRQEYKFNNNLSPLSSPKTPRRRSIQIKNLPIIERSPPKLNIESNSNDFIFAICLVDFHHIRGPEIQWWKSNYVLDINPDLFKNLPFQSLPDGSHLFEETFSNFNLIYDFSTNKSYDNLNDLLNFNEDPRNLQTLFGCACVRQININELTEEELKRNKDIKRSIVQKALVIINKKKPIFTKIKDKLSIITKSYFLQDNLSNFDVFNNLFENLNNEVNFNDNEEFFINLNLKQSLLKFKSNLLIIFKSLLLEKKIMIYSNNKLELLTKFQNNLISLIPNLIDNLVYSGCQLSDFEENSGGRLSKPTSLNTENRDSMLNFFGLPLKIFNTKGSFWNPYLPLQQINQLNFPDTESFMIGCSNLLFVNQLKELGVDLLINLDNYDLSFPNGLPTDLTLSSQDKNFINNLITNCSTNTTESNLGSSPPQNRNGGSPRANLEHENYVGNDDYIRFQFEDYLLSLLSTTRFNQYVQKFNQYPPGFAQPSNNNKESNANNNSNDPNNSTTNAFNEDTNANNGDLTTFNSNFINSWQNTSNFRLWDMTGDEFIFNFVNPRHIQVDSINQLSLSNFFQNLNLKFKFNDDLDQESKPNKFLKPKLKQPEDFEVVTKSAESASDLDMTKSDKENNKDKWSLFKKK